MKAKRNTFSLVSDVDVEESIFFNAAEFFINNFYLPWNTFLTLTTKTVIVQLLHMPFQSCEPWQIYKETSLFRK